MTTTVLIAVYFVVLGVLALVGVHRLLLTVEAARARSPERPPPLSSAPPLVVQLPLYNEAFVAERLLRAASRLRYPGPLSIQVLDDSDDDTRHVVSRVAEELRASGVDITVERRRDRSGFKAGALAHGLKASRAELVAIFDADFVPPPDFLERTVPFLLADPRCGLVQARWGHLNRDRSWLTRAQAVFLDGHFAIEHAARAAGGRFFNFNGTAGVWRREAILSAGGWRADTITEDLDLSYRAQLGGWRFAYVDDVVAPAELPERWAAFRSQQARWVRGSVETARLHLGRVLRDRSLPWRVRLDAAFHLTQNFAYVLMAALAVLLPACVVLRDQIGWRIPGGQALLSLLDLTMLTAGTFAMVIFYAAAVRRTDGRLRTSRWAHVAFALCVGAGISLANAREVWRGLVSRGSEFVRTPKRGDVSSERAVATYVAKNPMLSVGLELAFAAYFSAAVVYALVCGLWGALPFLLLYLVGFAAVGGASAWELIAVRRRTVEDPSEADGMALGSG